MNKRVYVYNMIGGEMSDKLMSMASPATTDFFVHKKLMDGGYTECVWIDECEYVTQEPLPEELYEHSRGSYEEFNTYLESIGYTIEYINWNSPILGGK